MSLISLVMVVLVEMSHDIDGEMPQHIWALLSDLYAANESLLELTDDRRRLHAAELIIKAWKACRSKRTAKNIVSKPDFIGDLENRLVACMSHPTEPLTFEETDRDAQQEPIDLNGSKSFLDDEDFNVLFNLDFADIDWSFWNSID